jgi:ABC-type sugar transport system ATPase subunit
MEEKESFVEMKNISKRFGGVQALNNVDLELYNREILGLVGDNGAGKSTLIKTLTGAIIPDSGEILIEGKKVEITHPSQSQKLGIHAIYQDLSLVGTFDLPSNMFLGQELMTRLFEFIPILDKKSMLKEGLKTLKETLNMEITNTYEPINNLSGGQQQAVAIARAVYSKVKVIIMDEPTASLGIEECEKIFGLIRRLKKQGCSLIVISHNLEHIYSICDRIQILRQGKVVGIRDVKETKKEEIVSLINIKFLNSHFADNSLC